MAPDINKSFGKSAMQRFGVGVMALGLTVGAFSSAAHSEDAKTPLMPAVQAEQNITLAAATTTTQEATVQTASFKDSALMKAGDFGDADSNNIGIVIYYGPGNSATPEQAGDWVVDKLNKRHQALLAENPELKPETIDAAYFIQPDPEGNVGISVGWLMGGTGVEAKEIRASVTDETLDEVINKRAVATRMLAAFEPIASR